MEFRCFTVLITVIITCTSLNGINCYVDGNFHNRIYEFAHLCSNVYTQNQIISLDNGSINMRIHVIKRAKGRVTYHANGVATFNPNLFCGDVESNPGPQTHAPKCSICDKTTRESNGLAV